MPKPAGPIPPGFHSLTAHLAVNGAAAYADFLKRAFNAIEIARSPGPGGKLMHVEVRIGDSALMFNDDFAAEPLPDAQGGIVNLLFMLPKADTAFLEAVTGYPASSLGDDTSLVDFGARGPIENQRLLLHRALSISDAGPGFPILPEGPRALLITDCRVTPGPLREQDPHW